MHCLDFVKNGTEDFVKNGTEEGIFIPEKKIENPEPSFSLNTVWLHVTNRCNLHCSYCCFDSGESLEKKMTTEELIQVIQELNDRNVKVKVSGGEPLLREDLFDIMVASSTYNCLITNGTLITEDNVDLIEKHFSEVSISLDGPDAATHEKVRGKNTFEKCMHAMNLLKERDFKLLEFSTIVMRPTFKAVPKMAELAFDMGVYLHLNQYVPGGRGKKELGLTKEEHLDTVVNTYKNFNRLITRSQEKQPPYMAAEGAYFMEIFRTEPKNNCGFGVKELSIAPNGDVYPCPLLHKESVKMENVLDEPLKNIHEKSVKVCSAINIKTIQGCSNCHVRTYRGGGCRARALQDTGDLQGKDPYCEICKFTIEYGMWYKGDSDQDLMMF
ncbi:MAG: hypothetical protein AYK18_06275 [Theionarchaea archaeon DG-70]|nr:MAG: hypothetical protein AYK18_06275 [Theionarchaea archaeon DG-70]